MYLHKFTSFSFVRRTSSYNLVAIVKAATALIVVYIPSIITP